MPPTLAKVIIFADLSVIVAGGHRAIEVDLGRLEPVYGWPVYFTVSSSAFQSAIKLTILKSLRTGLFKAGTHWKCWL